MEERGLQEFVWTGREGPFELLVSEQVFAPTHTSREMAEGLQVNPGDVVFTTLGFAGLYLLLGVLFVLQVNKEITRGLVPAPPHD